MKNRFLHIAIYLFFILPVGAFAQEQPSPKVAWNGYTQLRFSSNFQEINSFAMRRMKLWLNSAPGFNEHWNFHVQTTMSSYQNEKFLLQDVEVSYRLNNYKINIGQFVPQYSLERFQPDFEIPLSERADAINALIPNGTLGVRDIGLEGNYISKNKKVETWLGIFNGYGIKDYRFNNSGILLTHKTAIHLLNNMFSIGYSLMYRKADELQLLLVLPDTVRLTGNDFRYNVFTQFHFRKIQLQAEYLWANLDGRTADGYYVLALLNLGKHQLVGSWNQYNDLIESTDNLPVVHLGYNYLINSNKLKIMLDNGAQFRDGKLNKYFASIQLQLFFN